METETILSDSFFDIITNRNHTNATKYTYSYMGGVPEDVLPMWVADMDFKSPPCVLRALSAQIEHGIFGYSEVSEAYLQAVSGWYKRQYDYPIDAKDIIATPGVIFSINLAILAYTKPGDGVMIQRPVYYPFSRIIAAQSRKPINSPLVHKDGIYCIDFDDFERQIERNGVKLFILCNPHNPVGRVWTREELGRIGQICRRHDVLVISDEIHSDFVREPQRHIVFASICPEFSDMTITCTSPTKTFNIAGLQVANIFITSKAMRSKFQLAFDRSGCSEPNLMGLVACEAAYNGGDGWLIALKKYLQGNIDLFKETLSVNFPEARLSPPEAMYLLWVDFSKLGLKEEVLRRYLLEYAKVWLDHGTMFGPEGEGFQRFNIACPRSILRQALDRLVEMRVAILREQQKKL